MNPFVGLPDNCYWKRALRLGHPPSPPKFTLKPSDKIMTAGSCFARRVSSYLVDKGCNVIIKEDLPSVMHNYTVPGRWFFDETYLKGVISRLREQYNYGIFSARYDNIYHSAQLHQLLLRALGSFSPQDDIWVREDGKLVDAFRPKIDPDGYPSREALIADRDFHLKAVREAFSELDVLIFTFGLTEAWRSKKDGSFYPIAPGVVGGAFDPKNYEFVNLSVSDLVAHFEAFSSKLREINPNSKIIITVSPTPLMATARKDCSVLEANFYSKSALRAASDEIVQRVPNVSYFPSYEIVMSGVFQGEKTFENDQRTPSGKVISKIMQTFLACYLDGILPARKEAAKNTDFEKILEECDNILK